MFDVKLKDGRYFSNVDIWDCDLGEFDDIEFILKWNEQMQIYYSNDENGKNLLAEITCEDIEYICKSYTYKDGVNNG